MIPRAWLPLLGAPLCACQITLQALPVTMPETRTIDVRVFQRDDEGDYRPYLRGVRYAALFACRTRSGNESLRERMPGDASAGFFSIAFPSACVDSADLTLDVLPGFEHCQAGHTHVDALTLRAGRATVDVTVQCESPARRAQLEALSLLACHERATSVQRSGGRGYRVSGCGRSIELWCNDSLTPCEHGRVQAR
jgi:3',5'-cyclic AMP phosphodiesterase CpdA